MEFKNENNVRCKKCNQKFPRELVKKMLNGNEVYCEKCGAKNELQRKINQAKIIPQEIKQQTSINPIIRIPQRKKLSFLSKLKLKLKLESFYNKFMKTFHTKKSRGRGHRHRRGRRK